MPEKSAITFLILAWVIISWPFRMPPSSSPMMTSTIAISTSVKPRCLEFFICLSLRKIPTTRKVRAIINQLKNSRLQGELRGKSSES